MLVIQLPTRQVKPLPLNGFQSEGRDITQLGMSIIWSQMYWALWRRNTWNQDSFQQKDLTWSRRQSEEVFLGKWCWRDTEDELVIQEETQEWAGEGFIQKELMGRQHWSRYLQACCKSGGRGGVNLKRRKCLMGDSSANRNVERAKVSCFYLDQTLLCDQHTASPLSLNMTVAQRVRQCCPTSTGERWCSEAK